MSKKEEQVTQVQDIEETNELDISVEGNGKKLNRRKALRKMLVTGGVIAGAAYLPDKRTKPALDFIVVPSHAATSAPIPIPTPTGTPAGP